MKILRTIIGKTKRDRIRNAHIREELRIEDIQNQIKGNRVRWFGRVKRMNEYRLPKIAESEGDWKRSSGRPQTWWLD
jgi:hypothetical protein